jgi:hypothetical protein
MFVQRMAETNIERQVGRAEWLEEGSGGSSKALPGNGSKAEFHTFSLAQRELSQEK